MSGSAGYVSVSMAELRRITDIIDRAEVDCPRCLGEGLVCENHPMLPWEQPGGCGCGAGMPCRCCGG